MKFSWSLNLIHHFYMIMELSLYILFDSFNISVEKRYSKEQLWNIISHNTVVSWRSTVITRFQIRLSDILSGKIDIFVICAFYVPWMRGWRKVPRGWVFRHPMSDFRHPLSSFLRQKKSFSHYKWLFCRKVGLILVLRQITGVSYKWYALVAGLPNLYSVIDG